MDDVYGAKCSPSALTETPALASFLDQGSRFHMDGQQARLDHDRLDHDRLDHDRLDHDRLDHDRLDHALPGRGGHDGFSVKLALDIVVALVMLAALTPLMLLVALLVSCDGGPALFVQRRIGRGGRGFRCLKFRTMAVNADAILEEFLRGNPAAAREWAETRKLRHDPRVTWIGAFLRKSSIDELPQLINIVRGDMSLVGPRPIVQQEVSRYADNIAFYYAVRPGLTGLWQVSGRSETSFEQRVDLDVAYVTNRTIGRDLLILLKTLPAVLARKGAF